MSKDINDLKKAERYLQPCIKYSGEPLYKQVKKLEEEVAEVKQALSDFKFYQDNYHKQTLAVEIVDVIITGISFLYMLGYLSLKQRLPLYQIAFLKNYKRGYYNRDGFGGLK